MAKTLSVQELATTNELSNSQELGQLRKISTMQDIPLAETDTVKELTKIGEENEEGSKQYLDAEAERKLKTGSLKRFFRLSPKKQANNGDTLEVKKSGRQNDEQNDKPRDRAEKQKIKDSAHSSIDISGTTSKSTLKTSLSTYWNSVFKLKKSKRAEKTNSVIQSEGEETVVHAENLDNSDAHDNSGDGSSITEDIHALKISDELSSSHTLYKYDGMTAGDWSYAY
ncbi:hypothetical protein DOY81_002572 [Sarcophaga bullata]|nr:hypothetical protein DOY81_002572 [Sarcophaga bullata]